MLSTPIASNSRDNLLRLYQKQRTVDYPPEEKLSETGTLRKAWVDVLDSVERGEDIFVLGPRRAGAASTQLSRLSMSLFLSPVTATSVAHGD